MSDETRRLHLVQQCESVARAFEEAASNVASDQAASHKADAGHWHERAAQARATADPLELLEIERELDTLAVEDRLPSSGGVQAS
jgi:hypothetical protein